MAMKYISYKCFTNYPDLPKAKDNGVFLHYVCLSLIQMPSVPEKYWKKKSTALLSNRIKLPAPRKQVA